MSSFRFLWRATSKPHRWIHFGFFVTAFALADGAFGAILTVTNPSDSHVDGKLTLREAIAVSTSQDTIVFSIEGPVRLTRGEIIIDHDLTIAGPAVYLQTIQRDFEAPDFRIFSVNQGTVLFSNLAISNGSVVAEDGTATTPGQNAIGGAIKNAATLSLMRCEISANHLNGGSGYGEGVNKLGGESQGAGIFNSGTLSVEESLFYFNAGVAGAGGYSTSSAGGLGGVARGGAVCNTGTAILSNCTLFDNSASGGMGGPSDFSAGGMGGFAAGGAIFSSGSLTILNGTIYQNFASGGHASFGPARGGNGGTAQGGGLATSPDGVGRIEIRNTIVAHNIARGGLGTGPGQPANGGSQGPNVFGGVNSAGYNLIGDASRRSGWEATDQIGIDPLLQHLFHNNGGPTITLALSPGSPAIDRAANFGLTTDQRGLPRTFDDPEISNASGGDGTDVGAFELQPAPPAVLQNLSTRAQVSFDDGVLIGGIIVTGNSPKKVLVRVLGSGIFGEAIPEILFDPTLELHGPNGELIAANDNWKESQSSAIEGTGLQPQDDREAAIVAMLTPNHYTAIVRGKGSETGVSLLESYDLDPVGPSHLANVSARSFVGTENRVMIGGLILGSGGGGLAKIIVRGIGPSLSTFSIPLALRDPVLELYDEDGALIATNDNWKDTQQAAIQASGIPPADDRESAIVATLAPGSYTAVLRGKNDGTGVAIVEVYKIQ